MYTKIRLRIKDMIVLICKGTSKSDVLFITMERKRWNKTKIVSYTTSEATAVWT